MFSQRSLPIPSLLCLASLLLASCDSSKPSATWNTSLPAETWSTSGFSFPDDLSGIASANGSHGLMITDEGRSVQSAEILPSERKIVARDTIALLPESGKGKLHEIDAEGVTYLSSDQHYYIVGSHGLGKKKGDYQPERCMIFSLPFDSSNNKILSTGIRQSSLTPVFQKLPELLPYIQKPLQQNGLNVEGLTSSHGHLFIGLRAPNLEGNAVIVECDPASVFDQGTAQPILHKAAVGRGRGIRELVALHDGFLLLTGNASAEASKKFPQSDAPPDDNHFEILYWHPATKNQTQLLAALPKNGGKAEGLLLLEEAATQIKLLVIYDSKPGGAPTIVHIQRPTPQTISPMDPSVPNQNTPSEKNLNKQN